MSSSPESPRARVERLLRAQRRLATRPREEICAALEATAAAWLQSDSAWRARAEPVVAREGGFSPAMVRGALPAMIAPLAGGELRALAAEADAAAAARPRLTAQVLPSNVPGLAAIASALALLCRSATLLKPGRRDRGFTELWVQSLAAVDRELAACVDVVYWHGDPCGDGAALLAAADLVVATGSDDAVAALRARCSGRFAAYGSRLSVAFIDAASTADAGSLRVAAQGVARDIAVWDQRGCLSPRLCFVAGDGAAARTAAAAIAAALRELAPALPAGPMNAEEALAVHRFRDAVEWSAADGDAFFFADELGAGSVAVGSGAPLEPAPAHRCLRVVPVATSGSMLDLLTPWRDVVEGIGVAAHPGDEALAGELGRFGFPLVARAGELQRPPLRWRHGGRSRIAPWTESS